MLAGAACGCALLAYDAILPSVPGDRAFLDAWPNPVAPGGGPGRTFIRWSTGNGQVGRVYVRDGDAEKLFAEAASGAERIDWIAPGPPGLPVQFRLYQPDRGGSVLAAVTVRRADDRLSLARTAAISALWLGALLFLLNVTESRDGAHRRPRPPTVAAILAASLGCALTVMVFYPGVMSPDSLDQYRQAVTGLISDESSPPIMSFVWRQVDRLVPGPFGMMLVHAIVFWTALGLIARACTRTPFGAVLAVLGIGLFPPVFALLGILWKDVGFGASLLLFIGLVLTGRRRRSAWLLASALVPLFYACSVRLNAAPAILPLAWWLCRSAPAAMEPTRPLRFPLAGAILLSLLMLTLGVLTNRVIVTVPAERPGTALQGSMLFDLAGISVRSGELQLPEYLRRPEITLAALRQWYDPGVGDNGIIHRYDFFLAGTPEQRRQLRRAWWAAIAQHPAAYLRHRLDVMLTAFQITGVYDPYHRRIDPNDLGLTFPRRPLYEITLRGLDMLTPFLLRGWVFFTIATAVAWIAYSPLHDGAMAVALSGLLYTLPYSVISGGSDFRYVWWLVIAALVSGLQLAFCNEKPCGNVPDDSFY